LPDAGAIRLNPQTYADHHFMLRCSRQHYATFSGEGGGLLCSAIAWGPRVSWRPARPHQRGDAGMRGAARAPPATLSMKKSSTTKVAPGTLGPHRPRCAPGASPAPPGKTLSSIRLRADHPRHPSRPRGPAGAACVQELRGSYASADSGC